MIRPMTHKDLPSVKALMQSLPNFWRKIWDIVLGYIPLISVAVRLQRSCGQVWGERTISSSPRVIRLQTFKGSWTCTGSKESISLSLMETTRMKEQGPIMREFRDISRKHSASLIICYTPRDVVNFSKRSNRRGFTGRWHTRPLAFRLKSRQA